MVTLQMLQAQMAPLLLQTLALTPAEKKIPGKKINGVIIVVGTCPNKEVTLAPAHGASQVPKVASHVLGGTLVEAKQCPNNNQIDQQRYRVLQTLLTTAALVSSFLLPKRADHRGASDHNRRPKHLDEGHSSDLIHNNSYLPREVHGQSMVDFRLRETEPPESLRRRQDHHLSRNSSHKCPTAHKDGHQWTDLVLL